MYQNSKAFNARRAKSSKKKPKSMKRKLARGKFHGLSKSRSPSPMSHWNDKAKVNSQVEKVSPELVDGFDLTTKLSTNDTPDERLRKTLAVAGVVAMEHDFEKACGWWSSVCFLR